MHPDWLNSQFKSGSKEELAKKLGVSLTEVEKCKPYDNGNVYPQDIVNNTNMPAEEVYEKLTGKKAKPSMPPGWLNMQFKSGSKEELARKLGVSLTEVEKCKPYDNGNVYPQDIVDKLNMPAEEVFHKLTR